ncbi:hypothetical protein JCM3770_006141 [Rhodotorula araucariae]
MSSTATAAGHPSLPNDRAASSPAVASSKSSASASSDEGGGTSAATSSTGFVASMAQTSASSFPRLDSLGDSLPAERATPSQSDGVVKLAAAVVGVVPGDSRVVVTHVTYVPERAAFPGGTMQAWSPPGPSALGMSMGGLPLIPLVGGVAVDTLTGGSGRRTGSCKFFNAQKGFGFILDDNAEELGDDEVFVHYTAIAAVQGGPHGFRSLLEGEAVEYNIVQGPKGWQAQDVTGPNGAPCIGTPPGGLPKSSTYPTSLPQPRSGGPLRRSSTASSVFTSPMRSARGESSLYGSSHASPADTARTSLPSPSSRALRLHPSGSAPAYPGGFSPSAQTYSPMHMYSVPPSLQQSPPMHYQYTLPPEDGQVGYYSGGAPFYGSPEDSTSSLPPIDPHFVLPFGSFAVGPPGMDNPAPPPFYPISSSTSPGNAFSHSPTSYSGPLPAFPGVQATYPISNSPMAAPYLHLQPPNAQFSPYGGFVPTSPLQGMYYDPSVAPPPLLAPPPYPAVYSSGEVGADGAYLASGPAASRADGAPSGLAVGWADGDRLSNGNAGDEAHATVAAPVKVAAPVPERAREQAAEAT